MRFLVGITHVLDDFSYVRDFVLIGTFLAGDLHILPRVYEILENISLDLAETPFRCRIYPSGLTSLRPTLDCHSPGLNGYPRFDLEVSLDPVERLGFRRNPSPHISRPDESHCRK